MHVTSAEFITSAVKPAHYPPAQLPEVAFAGRSNVGKSSMINTLLNRRHLVKTSATPGHTQLINFFLINQSFVFVDLPGYGYARAPETVRRQWQPMIETYLSSRSTLQAVVLILDIRRRITPAETDLMAYLSHYGVATLPVLTKADKLSRNQQNHQTRLYGQELGLPTPQLVLFSARTRQGRDPLWKRIEQFLLPHTP